MAVADGHGDRRVPRAAHGAMFAAESGVRVLTRALRTRHGEPEQSPLNLAATVEELVDEWRDRVLRDYRDRPPTSDKLDGAALERWDPDDADAIVGLYGTTLIAAAADDRALLVCQIGDGDLGIVYEDGSRQLPLAPPDTVGQFTTSLAMREARTHVRISVVDLAPTGDVVIWACTDGFSGAQADADWRDLVAGQLSSHCHLHGPDDVAARLPQWLQPAAETAGDDTTMALLIRTAEVTAPTGPDALATTDRPAATALRE